MINAEQARKISENNEQFITLQNQISDLIESKAKDGQSYILYYYRQFKEQGISVPIAQTVFESLEKLGYSTRFDSDSRCNDFVKISW